MAKTIIEIQAAIDAQNLDARQLINLIVDYLQANPPGGAGAIPTLAQVLTAGNNAGGQDIEGLNRLQAENGSIIFNSPIDMDGGDLIGVNNINGDPYPPA